MLPFVSRYISPWNTCNVARSFSSRAMPYSREKYRFWLPIQTRWKDNDMYGHVNNTEYYSYFDTVINTYLIKYGGLDPVTSKTIGLCVESHCNFFSALEFPMVVEVGLFASHKGKSSLKYEIGIFGEGCETASAQGHFVHVFVDADTRRPTQYPKEISDAIDHISVG